MSLPSTLNTDAPATTTCVPTEAAVDSTTTDASGEQETSNTSANNATEAVPGIQIETDILLLIPETVAEEGPLTPLETEGGGQDRALDDSEEYGTQEKHALSYKDDLEAAGTLVFRPLFRHRKRNNPRRRVDINDGQRRKDEAHKHGNGERRRQPVRFCPPCRYYFY
jgi:hypothetical protein